jgi:hypothetical protein
MMLPALAAAGVVSPSTSLEGIGVGEPYAAGRVDRVAWYNDAPSRSQPLAFTDDYEVTVNDIGTRIQQVATVTSTPDAGPCNQWSIGAASPSVLVKAASTLKLHAKSKAGTSPLLTIRVSQQGTNPIRGFVTISWKGPRTETQTIRISEPNGHATTTKLPGLKSGSYTLTGTFIDTSGETMNSTSATGRLRIRS